MLIGVGLVGLVTVVAAVVLTAGGGGGGGGGGAAPSEPSSATGVPTTVAPTDPQGSVATTAATVASTDPAVPLASISLPIECNGLTPEDGLPLVGCEEGVSVLRVQESLADRGYTLAIDGQYGTETAAAVVEFQQSEGLPVTGAVDAATWQLLDLDLDKVCDRSKERWVCLTRAWLTDGGTWLNATYEWSPGFVPNVATDHHFHFYGGTIPGDMAGAPGPSENWVVWDQATLRVSVEQAGYIVVAEELCVLVGTPSHTVERATGNCMPIEGP